MKTIAVVTDGNNNLQDFINSNLQLIFGKKVHINNYYLNNLNSNTLINSDVVLSMIEKRVIEIKKYVKDYSKIITIHRSIKNKDIYELFSIPSDIDVLVVNDNEYTTLETISNLYKLGINHLNLIPYTSNINYSHIKIAITAGEINLVPKYINKIIDIGNRYIDVSTFLQIITKLNIDDKEVNERLIRYSDELINLNSGINNKYKTLTIRNDVLNTIINLTNIGMCMISEKGEIIFCNKSLYKMMNIHQDIIGKNISEIISNNLKSFFSLDKAINTVVTINNKYYNVNKYVIESYNKVTGYYYSIQEITYIRKLEQNLSIKLKEKGHVARYSFNDIITYSTKMINLIKLCKKISLADYTILITGASGTGKELFAQSVHNNSPRSKQPFIAINCAAMPSNLLESELFGYEEGAFTGASKGGKKGLFEKAHNGTIFLDEIGEMPLYLQTKLLRVLQENQVMRVGGDKVINIDVRVIAATNLNLLDSIKEKNFRADLYYRINVLTIKVPSLKDRDEDIPKLLLDFMENKIQLSKEVIEILNNYDWPGNIRELKNTAKYIDILCNNDIVTANDLPFNITNNSNDFSLLIAEIEEKISISTAREILLIINDANIKNTPIGRKSIVSRLIKKNITLSEAEIRTILTFFKDLNIIYSESSRRGSKLTLYGYNFINSLL